MKNSIIITDCSMCSYHDNEYDGFARIVKTVCCEVVPEKELLEDGEGFLPIPDWCPILNFQKKGSGEFKDYLISV